MPIIGIVGRNYQEKYLDINVIGFGEYVRRSVINAGGTPFGILPPQNVNYYEEVPSKLDKLTDHDKKIIIEQLDLCDGIIIPGGLKRFEYDIFVLKYALDNDIPVFGICLGMQIFAMLNKDGEMVLNSKKIESNINHCELDKEFVHNVIIDKESIIYKITNKEKLLVNSRHNLEITNPETFKIYGKSEDGVVELIERHDKRFAVGVQWHPEILAVNGDIDSIKIMEYFIKKADEYKNENKI